MRGFSDEQRNQIREDLVKSGREQFQQYGPERTRVKDITEPVGIAKPTFYQFFDSKGELYLEIFTRVSKELGDELQSEISAIEDTREAVKRLFTKYVEFIEENPHLVEVMSHTPPREMFRNVPQEQIDQVRENWLNAYAPVIEELQHRTDAALVDYDPMMILALLRPIGLMHLYKEEGTTRDSTEFERMQEAHIETLVNGLTCRQTIDD